MNTKEYTVSILKAQTASLPFGLIAVAEFFLFVTVWGFEPITAAKEMLLPWYFISIFLVGIVIHELIHGVSWMAAGRLSLRQIKFGFYWKTVTPYAHCKVPISKRAYLIGTVMPAIVLGFLPFGISLVTGDGWTALFGILFTFAAVGDFLIVWLIRSVPWDRQVGDHPTRVGCFVYEDDVTA